MIAKSFKSTGIIIDESDDKDTLHSRLRNIMFPTNDDSIDLAESEDSEDELRDIGINSI